MKLIPVLTDHSKQFFSEFGFPTLVRQGFTSFNTSHLKPGARFSLLGIALTTALLETGLMDCTDSIDPAVSLKGILLRVTRPHEKQPTDLLYYHEVEQLPRTIFTASAGTYREISLNFTTVLGMSVDACPLALAIHAVGSVNLELGDTEVHFKVQQEGESDHTVEVVGYDLNAYSINYNRRPVEELRTPHFAKA